jgi:hypothetical protein
VLPSLDKKAILPTADCHVDSKGRIWTTNGRAIFLLKPNGEVAETLGHFATVGGLHSVANLAFGEEGRMYALDGLSGEVHVFGPEGEPVRVLKPRAGDVKKLPIDEAELQVTRSGDVYVNYCADGFVHFSPSGERLGPHPLPDDPSPLASAELRPSKPSGATQREEPLPPTWRWWNCRLIDESGKAVRQIVRWPNLDWMTVTNAAASPDGALAVFESSGYRFGHPGWLAFYSAEGKPLSQVVVPPELRHLHASAFTGEYVLFARQRDVVLVNRKGAPVGRIPFPDASGTWTVYSTREGFNAFDGKATILKYKLPGATSPLPQEAPLRTHPGSGPIGRAGR